MRKLRKNVIPVAFFLHKNALSPCVSVVLGLCPCFLEGKLKGNYYGYEGESFLHTFFLLENPGGWRGLPLHLPRCSWSTQKDTQILAQEHICKRAIHKGGFVQFFLIKNVLNHVLYLFLNILNSCCGSLFVPQCGIWIFDEVHSRILWKVSHNDM